MISGNLEYLMSSLPYLTFQNNVELRSQISALFAKYAGDQGKSEDLVQILEREAGKFLPSHKNSLFHRINLQNIHELAYRQSGDPVLARFATYRYQLKQGVAQLRRARRQGQDKPAKEKVHIITPGNPLEEEVQLLKLQWDELEEISIGHYADFSALIAYKLKLLLLLRWWGFEMETGAKVFSEITKPGHDGG